MRDIIERRSTLKRVILAGGMCLFMGWLIASGCVKSTPVAAVRSAPMNVQCQADSSWVSNPSQPDLSQDPENKVLSNPLCGFYQDSWQSFLYLTSPAQGGNGSLNFEGYETLQSLFPSTTVQCPDTDERLATGNKARVFKVAGAKPADGEATQAGSHGILVDQTGEITYYEQRFDPNFVNFTQACQLTNSTCQQMAPVGARLPAKAIELKSSWRPITQADPNFNSYYTIPDVTVLNPTTQKCEQKSFLGLVGFHLVFFTPGHPEGIWATFEHVANAPEGPCASGKPPPPNGLKWAYYNPDAPAGTPCNTWTPGPDGGVPSPLPKSQIVRNWPFGDDGSDPTNVPTLLAVNAEVQNILPTDSVWRNYFLAGAVWTTGSLPAVDKFIPDAGTANERGSLTLSNTTMESFTQLPKPAPSDFMFPTSSNCFSCHNAGPSQNGSRAKPEFQVSHAFGNAQETGSCNYSQLPALCQASDQVRP
jgi:hypothetical protein